MSSNLQLSFWEMMGVEDGWREGCLRAVRDCHVGARIEELEHQGGCSFTVLIVRAGSEREGKIADAISRDSVRSDRAPETRIIQFRPEKHGLDLRIAQAATETYGHFAPKSRGLNFGLPNGLQAFELEMMRGTPFSRCQRRSLRLDPEAWGRQLNLIRSFAAVIAKAWLASSQTSHSPRRTRADSPIIDDSDTLLSQCTGKVGANITSKLHRLARYLPDAALRRRAANTLSRLSELKGYPVVLNHGDLIPSNILIDPDTWEITGIIDWAEAEWLPFGMCLYGLEHFLGFLDYTITSAPKFQYYYGAERLRKFFWEELWIHAPAMKERMKVVRLAGDIGVFLWYGYAWDEGAIDRVVNEVDDKQELDCLRRFLERDVRT
ncbi:hypothetical protein K469DRAFT_546609 [Zopfia rhizophila CBS 207.26]|uniref:Aminoglycoside phosphotransferase domain-containing protein n=1 Tax=Zopfia rhizophila CBS 207.26 TaxID=1314779 RepID=A0A6A6EUX6_9PEZI|nr:hypothetical protein K469DRAFT_546609 [Zopfia rhizophila CBS 207.26]